MAERVVYLNGEYLAEKDAKVSVLDRGFRWGDAVYDATRTFEGRLFKLQEHVERFFRSLRYARIDPCLDKAAVTAHRSSLPPRDGRHPRRCRREQRFRTR